MDATRPPLVIGSVSAAPGRRATGLVPVDVGGGTVLEVPVVVVHGARPGPRVAITAGIHGAEYVSIAALREVVLALDPEAVSGSIVAVLTARPAAFAARAIYVNPLDGHNLTRAFPRHADGSCLARDARHSPAKYPGFSNVSHSPQPEEYRHWSRSLPHLRASALR